MIYILNLTMMHTILWYEVINCTKSESLSKVRGQESLIFQIYETFSINFPNIYSDYLLADVTVIHFSCYFGK